MLLHVKPVHVHTPPSRSLRDDLVFPAALAIGCISDQVACMSDMGGSKCWLYEALHVCRIPGTGWIRALERMWAARRPGASGTWCPASYEASPAGGV